MKKIGIMSMQRVVNYGSFLQAYGLKKTIEELGHDVQFVDFEFEKSLVNDESSKLKIYFNKIIKNINIFEFLKKKKNINLFKTKYLDFLKIINVGKEKNIRPNIDTLVIGSDEVFNCVQKYPVGYSRELFGKNYENIPVISYAASFGFTTLEKLKKYKIKNEIKYMLNNMKDISVRDENSYNICKSLLNKKVNVNLDPVLISNYDNEITNKIVNKDYIIVYAYTGRLTKEEEKYIKKFAKKTKKKIISLGFYQKIADLNLVVSPFEVLEYFKKADYVITDTFHGTIFSIKMNTKFCTIIRDSNKNKLTTLLKKLKQEKQIVEQLNDIEKLYYEQIDFSDTNSVIEEERIKTIEYLSKNI